MNEIRHMTHKSALELIVKYQATGDEEIFGILLAKYDDLLLKTLYEYQRLNIYMRMDPLQELYHIAIVGFSAALKVIPPKESPSKLPAWIKAYVRHALDNAYKPQVNDKILYRNRHWMNLESNHDKTYNNVENNIDVQVLLKCRRLSDKERKVLKLSFLNDMTLNEISEQMDSLTRQQIHYIKKCALKKLKDCCSGEFDCKKKTCIKFNGGRV